VPSIIVIKQELTSQVSAETDPVSLLAKVVSLLYIQVTIVFLFLFPPPFYLINKHKYLYE